MSESLETVPVNLSPADMLRVLAAFENRSEGVVLVADKVGSSISFGVWVDSSGTGESIVLHPNGTWTASTHVVIGTKKT